MEEADTRGERGVGPQIGYNFNLGGTSIYTNLRGYTEFGSYRRVRGYAIYATVNVPGLVGVPAKTPVGESMTPGGRPVTSLHSAPAGAAEILSKYACGGMSDLR